MVDLSHPGSERTVVDGAGLSDAPDVAAGSGRRALVVFVAVRLGVFGVQVPATHDRRFFFEQLACEFDGLQRLGQLGLQVLLELAAAFLVSLASLVHRLTCWFWTTVLRANILTTP